MKKIKWYTPAQVFKNINAFGNHGMREIFICTLCKREHVKDCPDFETCKNNEFDLIIKKGEGNI